MFNLNKKYLLDQKKIWKLQNNFIKMNHLFKIFQINKNNLKNIKFNNLCIIKMNIKVLEDLDQESNEIVNINYYH